MDQQYLAGLDALLNELVFGATDTARIRAATSTLNTQYYTNANCIPALTEILQKSPHWQIRQLAAVELRKRTSKFWPQLDEGLQQTIKTQLLEYIVQEPQALTRHSAARVISSIAKLELPANKWTDLIQFLYQCCSSPNAGHREVGVYILFTLFEVIADFFQEHIRQLFELFKASIADPESKAVRVITLQALGKIADFIEPENKEEVKMFQDLVPAMVAVLQQCLADSDEDSASKGFEVFDSILMLETPLLSKHIAELIDFFLGVSANQEYDGSMRVMALSFMMWTAVYKKARIQRLKLVGPIVQRLMPIGVEEDPEDIDEDSPSRSAFKVLNALATNLPPQQVFPVVIEHVLAYMQNQDPRYRKSAMMSLAVSIEGCADFLRPKINDLLPLVCTGLQDPDLVVRRAACMALGCLADELDEEIAAQHATLLPLILNLMNDPNTETNKQACNALDAILEGLGDNVIQYLPQVMEKLVFLLDHSGLEVKATVTAAIGSAAHAAGEEFKPYFPEVIARLKHMMTIKGNHEEMMLRGVATDTAGAIAEAVGRELVQPHLNELIHYATEGMQFESSRLRECAYCFFAVIGRVIQDDLAPYLNTIVPQLIQSCQAEEKDDFLGGEEDLGTGDMDDEDDEQAFQFNSAIADEKEIAADALGEIFENTRSHFLPYVEASVQELVKLSEHYSDSVRKAVVGSLFQFLNTFHEMSNPDDWVAGLPPKTPVHENVDSMIKLVIPTVLRMWEEEDDKLVVIQICHEMVASMKSIGPALIADNLDAIATHILQVLEKKALCQMDQEDEDGLLDEEEQAEHDALLISAASDVIGALSQTVGPEFLQYARVFIPHMKKYYKKSRPVSDRSMAIGCLGEVCSGLKQGVTEFTEDMLNLFLKSLNDEEEEVRSNGAFAIGVLCENASVDLSSQYLTILMGLHPLFQRQSLANMTDNACGALARMIMARPEAVPMDQVLPVFLQALPLRRDFEENEPVYRCIFTLIRANNPIIMSHAQHLIQVFQQVLSPPEFQLKPKTREEMTEILSALTGQQ
ncbi:ARM repeat-containing protein [Basidiobolus meristosporus CBS 931.73]|uniref:ARM repeat-containing protein n=1 Tax=Basidiobolus meristosporus CBS 931.73 TaxID=1314790 RepID=A0A1Y1Y5H2_9FUNG|nr:ARM repeat-containing protein [Basidiobolus meristosporus CBS 931.73]|eukprot:ORX93243.1 ARM repeat-containing protein [Basidiobolus meristosporus CBS 931.73]